MSPVSEHIRREIERSGPISFRSFMEEALYNPVHGYYRRSRDPFGKTGDFFTAEQIQPVFGRLMSTLMRSLWTRVGSPGDFTVVELGAGRQDMVDAFSEFRYVPVDVGYGELPQRFSGVVFANEFFDALPVEVVRFHEGRFRQMRVGIEGDRFVWKEGDAATAEMEDYLRRFAPARDEGCIVEINLEALRWIDRIAERLERGFVVVIDYGYTAAELARFPQGTLMSYYRHQGLQDVLADPGERDITAHVNFPAIEDQARRAGFNVERRERLAQTVLELGQPDGFSAVLAATNETEAVKLRLQLKTLLFGMGETFWTLVLERRGTVEGAQ